MFTNMRFEPAGMTDDPEIRFATSLVDYIFRRLAVEYLPFDERKELGVLTVGERAEPTLPGVEEAATPQQPVARAAATRGPRAVRRRRPARPPAPPVPTTTQDADVMLCYVCGDIMQRAGSCFACPSLRRDERLLVSTEHLGGMDVPPSRRGFLGATLKLSGGLVAVSALGMTAFSDAAAAAVPECEVPEEPRGGAPPAHGGERPVRCR